MKKILIIDKKKEQAAILGRIISEYYSAASECSIYACDTYNDSTSRLRHIVHDICFINAGKLDTDSTGIDIAYVIRNEFNNMLPIIFTTTEQEYNPIIINDIHCYGVITSPYNPDDINKLLNSIDKLSPEHYKALIFKDLYGVNLKISFQDILYIENHSHTMYIHTVDGSTYMTKAYSLSTLSEELDNDFIRCHKKYIVAIRQIRAYDKATAMITLGSLRLPVGRTFMPAFEKCFLPHRTS